MNPNNLEWFQWHEPESGNTVETVGRVELESSTMLVVLDEYRKVHWIPSMMILQREVI